MRRLHALLTMMTIACGASPTDVDPGPTLPDPMTPDAMKPDPVPTVPPAGADFGDAPDGRVQPDGTFAGVGYPTLLGANGARALDVSKVALASAPTALEISRELDANDRADPDGEPNFIRNEAPQPDAENRDDFDNGIIRARLNMSDPTSPRLVVVIGAALRDQAAAGTYYLNVLFDRDVDGAWNGANFDPTIFGNVDEWIVRNVGVDLNDVGVVREVEYVVPLPGAVFSRRAVDVDPYMRIALTGKRIETSTWSGEGEFAVGEIEDWVVTGLDDPPRFDCDAPADAVADYVFDFAGANQIALPCAVGRPAFASAATQIDFAHVFRQIIPAGNDVTVTCAPNPLPGVTRAGPSQASPADPLPVACIANKTGNVTMTTPIVAVDLTTDLDGAVSVKSGLDSAVGIQVSFDRSFLRFIDQPPTELRVCEGLTGSYDQINGGLVIQLTRDLSDCAMIRNDGETDGTFVVSGGTGFRGRGEMFFAPLVGNSAFLPGGGVLSASFNGTPLGGPAFDVPVDRSSMNVLEIRFTSGLEVVIDIGIEFVEGGQNIVEQTIRTGRYRR